MQTAHIETLANGGLDEIKALLPTHYDELSEHKLAGIPLDPQYDVYLSREALGQVLYVTLRDHGKLVGYIVSFVMPGLHYRSCLTGTGDIFFVYPDKRGQAGGVLMFKTWIDELTRRGVSLAQVGLKVRHAVHARALFEALGFFEAEIMFWKFLKKDDA